MRGRMRRGGLAAWCGLLAGCTVPIETEPATVGSIAPPRATPAVIAPLKPVLGAAAVVQAKLAPAVAASRPAFVRVTAASPPPVRTAAAEPMRPLLCEIGFSRDADDVEVGKAPCEVMLRPTFTP